MNYRRFIFFGVGVITVLAAAIFVRTFVHAAVYAPEDIYVAPQVATEQVSAEASITTASANVIVASTAPAASSVTSAVTPGFYPKRFLIPSLGIDASVQLAYVNTKGNMSAPTNFTDVAWYRGGTVPGDKGSAVFDGHVDNGLGLAGVFKHLENISVGDDIYVTDYDGTQIHFVVTNIQSYDYQHAPVDMIFNENDAAYIKLITCEGDWVAGDKTYDHRLVVTGKLVS